jgi:hypothetical protein
VGRAERHSLGNSNRNRRTASAINQTKRLASPPAQLSQPSWRPSPPTLVRLFRSVLILISQFCQTDLGRQATDFESLG